MPSLATADAATSCARFNGPRSSSRSSSTRVISLLVGLLYAVLLPMVPRRPMLLGGLVAPLLWTGLLWASLGIINPIAQRAHRLALVRRLADRLRPRRGLVVSRARADRDACRRAARGARGHRVRGRRTGSGEDRLPASWRYVAGVVARSPAAIGCRPAAGTPTARCARARCSDFAHALRRELRRLPRRRRRARRRRAARRTRSTSRWSTTPTLRSVIADGVPGTRDAGLRAQRGRHRSPTSRSTILVREHAHALGRRAAAPAPRRRPIAGARAGDAQRGRRASTQRCAALPRPRRHRRRRTAARSSTRRTSRW